MAFESNEKSKIKRAIRSKFKCEYMSNFRFSFIQNNYFSFGIKKKKGKQLLELIALLKAFLKFENKQFKN